VDTLSKRLEHGRNALASIALDRIGRVPGTEVFLFTEGEADWGRILAGVSQAGWLATEVLVATLTEARDSKVALHEQAKFGAVAHGIMIVELSFGRMDVPDVPQALAYCPGLHVNLATTTYLVDVGWINVARGNDKSILRRLWQLMPRRPTSTRRLHRLPSRHVFTMCRG
jgi:K+ transporter